MYPKYFLFDELGLQALDAIQHQLTHFVMTVSFHMNVGFDVFVHVKYYMCYSVEKPLKTRELSILLTTLNIPKVLVGNSQLVKFTLVDNVIDIVDNIECDFCIL